jgi:hypothetical protein
MDENFLFSFEKKFCRFVRLKPIINVFRKCYQLVAIICIGFLLSLIDLLASYRGRC